MSASEVTTALSIRQPWAWLVANGFKDIENRIWRTQFRGRVLIHASATMRRGDYWTAFDFVLDRVSEKIAVRIPRPDDLEFGGIIGSVEIVDCVTAHESPWFEGPHGFVLRNPTVTPFRAVRGALKFFPITQ